LPSRELPPPPKTLIAFHNSFEQPTVGSVTWKRRSNTTGNGRSALSNGCIGFTRKLKGGFRVLVPWKISQSLVESFQQSSVRRFAALGNAVDAALRLSYGGQNNAWGGPKTRANVVQAEGERNDSVAFLFGMPPLVERLPVVPKATHHMISK
jgi:hypothetical protein